MSISYFEDATNTYSDTFGIVIPEVHSHLGQMSVGPQFEYRHQFSPRVVLEPRASSADLDFAVRPRHRALTASIAPLPVRWACAAARVRLTGDRLERFRARPVGELRRYRRE